MSALEIPFVMTENVNVDLAELPAKPKEPDLSECCQRNCENCVFVYYERAVERWRKKVADMQSRNSPI